MSDTKDTPEWMTDEWLGRALKNEAGRVIGDMAREILRLRAELRKAKRCLTWHGFEDLGGQEWKPPLGPNPNPLLERIDRLRAILVDCVNRGTNGGCSAEVSDDFLASLPDDLAKGLDIRRKAEAELAKVTADRNANSVAMAQAVIRADRAEVELEERTRAMVSAEGIVERVEELTTELGRPFGHDVTDWIRGAVKERDAARAEVERLNHPTDDGKMAMANVISALTEADKGRTHGSPVERIRDLACERDAAIRAKHEFAASEVERLAEDWFSDKLKDEDLFGAAKSRAAELRKAAGAAAPVDFLAEMRNAKPGPCEIWGPMIDEAPGATLPDVEPKVTSGKVVEFSTPAADARQPLPLGRLEELRRAYAAGAEKGAMTEPTKSWCRDAVLAIDELIDLRARLAASEKAKSELVAASKSAIDWFRQVRLGPNGADAIENLRWAAERARGAS